MSSIRGRDAVVRATGKNSLLTREAEGHDIIGKNFLGDFFLKRSHSADKVKPNLKITKKLNPSNRYI